MIALGRLYKEWWLVFALSCLAMAGAVRAGVTDHFDYFLYDLLQRASVRQPDPRILLVAIDNRSLEEFGAWPWPREVQAKLIAALGKARPRALALDMLLLERRDDAGDKLLADAIGRSRPVFLPVAFDVPGRNGAGFTVTAPLPQFQNAANGLANVNLSPDRDGEIRRAYLNYTDGKVTWSSLAWLLARPDLPLASPVKALRRYDRSETTGVLRGLQPVLINYAGPAGTIPSVSASNVLRGEVPEELLHERLILVGATASGLGDVHATPVGRDGSLMPGVEIQANLVDTLLGNRQIIPAAGFVTYAFALAPLMLLMVTLRFIRLHRTLGVVVALLAGILVLSFVLLRLEAFWLPPGSALLGVALAYPLWTWRKLAVAVSYISAELKHAAAESGPLERRVPDLHKTDFLNQQIGLLRLASDRGRDLRRFLNDRLMQMPDNVIVTNLVGEVVLANVGATMLFNELHSAGPLDRADDLLMHFVRQSDAGRNKLDFFVISRLGGMPWLCQAETGDGKSYDIRFEPQRSSDEELIGYVIRIVDISQQVTLQRQREDILQLLTHDMRAPQASIIALLDSVDEKEIGPKTASRVRNYAHRTLKLADDFVHLARAQSLTYTFGRVDLSDVTRDAADALWPQAKLRKIALELALPEQAIFVQGERSLLARMLINLIDNAVKYSEVGGGVRVELTRVERAGTFARLTVRNAGHGISQEQMAVLYERFQRGSSGPASGVGLGLAFVHTVVVRHHGSIHCESEPGGETCFTVAIPLDF